ncbi:MAG TPA: amidase [Dehalococcoidales bacterium]|nr:amidase [Dehalococcoidales bacterium]
MSSTKQPYSLTITEAASAIASGELTPSQLVKSCLERIDAVDDAIKAWALVDRQGALATARQLEQELAKGQRRGALHGIPVGIKDIFYTAGLPTEAGAKAWAGFVPDYDATSVARLKEAGAIVLGKTHTTEFAFFDPAPTRNPWNTEHTPGGSSSGSGAGVAAGMCPAALGSQTMGSVLRPAAYNGIVGFKPQYGRISVYGVVPLSPTLDHVGILARTVKDVALVFQAIAGNDPKDALSLNEPVPDCLAALEKQPSPPRLGLVRAFFYDHADEEMRRHTDEIVARLRQAGATIEEITPPPSFTTIIDNARIFMAAEAAVSHREGFARHGDKYRAGIRKLIEDGQAVSSAEYKKALKVRLQQCTEMEPLLYKTDALITPGIQGPAPHGLSSTGNPVMQAPWTIMGIPSISLPSGLSQSGLPLSIQLAGPPKAEDRLLAVARWCESVLKVDLRPPLG